MYQVSDVILDQGFDGLKVKKVVSNENLEVLMISLESGKKFPEHTSPRDANLIVLEGEIEFYINKDTYSLKKHQTLDFPAMVLHWVSAKKDSKFLIVR